MRFFHGIILEKGGVLLSVLLLKLVAVVSMFIDHTTYVLRLSGNITNLQLYTAGRSIGRAAFVIFCFLLVNGFDKTHDRRKYLSRLILFAVISQIPFSLAFTAANYRGPGESSFTIDYMRALFLLLPLAAYYLTVCERRFEFSLCSLAFAFLLASTQWVVNGVCLLGTNKLNVFYTLAAAMASMMALDYLFSARRAWPRMLLIICGLAAEIYFVQQHADYGLLGLALILMLYFCRGRKPLQLAVVVLWCFAQYELKYPYLAGSVAAILPLALYNGKLGPKIRTFFYLFYPVHLAILGTVFVLLSRQ